MLLKTQLRTCTYNLLCINLKALKEIKQKVQSKQKPFYPFLYGQMELKAAICQISEQ